MSSLQHNSRLSASSFAVEALESRLLLSAVPLPVDEPVLKSGIQPTATDLVVIATPGEIQTAGAGIDNSAGGTADGLFDELELVSLSHVEDVTFDGSATEVVVAPSIEVHSDATLARASVAITGGYDGAEDRLTVAGQASDHGTAGALQWAFDAATGTLTFSGLASAAVYQQALRSVVYRNAAMLTTEAPREGAREISIAAHAENAGADVPQISSQLVVSLVAGQGPPVGSFTVTPGATLAGSGSYSAAVVNNGTISPGHSPGFQDYPTYTQTSDGVLEIELGGTSAGTGYDQVRVTDQANLDGTLEIKLIDGFMPEVGQTFDIITYDSSTGRFKTVTGLTGFGDGSVYLELVQTATGIKLIARAASTTSTGVSDFIADKLQEFANGAIGGTHTFGGLSLALDGLFAFTDLWVTFNNIAWQGGTNFTGNVTFSAASVTLFPGQTVTASLTDGADADNVGVAATYNLATKTYSFTLDHFELAIGAFGFTADAGSSSYIEATPASFTLAIADATLSFPGAYAAGSFSFAKANDVLSVAASGVTLLLGSGLGTAAQTGVTLTGGDLALQLDLATGAYAALARGTGGLTGVADVTITGAVEFAANTYTGAQTLALAGESTEIAADSLYISTENLTVNLAGFAVVTGAFVFYRETNVVLAAGVDLTVFMGSGFGTASETGVRVTEGVFALLLDVATGDLALGVRGQGGLVNVTDVTLTGELTVIFNRFDHDVSLDLPVGGGSVELIAPAGVTYITGNATLDVLGFVQASGSFTIYDDANTLIIGATNVSAFVGANGAGVQVTDGLLGLVSEYATG
ncbi:MAG TPA: hypothetical protein VGD81_05720, partial [Opitutaceae bacterium]